MVQKKMMKVNRNLENLQKLSPTLKQNPCFLSALSGLNNKLRLMRLSYYCFEELDIWQPKKHCTVCKKLEIITSECNNFSSMCINTAMVTAVVNTGQGFSQLDTYRAFLNMPNMFNSKEAALPIMENNINEEGIPLITVIADGARSKRSYKSGYNALSIDMSILLDFINIVFRCAVTKAILQRKIMPLSENEKVVLLKKDILNRPFHVFGSHFECSSYFCTDPKNNEINLVPQMETCGLWADISRAKNFVAYHGQSLIYNVNNNAVEGFNSIVAKFVCGKRVNFSLRGKSLSL
ncbi:hypothetical protein QTP88_024786 [Uroleucon formosanum]